MGLFDSVKEASKGFFFDEEASKDPAKQAPNKVQTASNYGQMNQPNTFQSQPAFLAPPSTTTPFQPQVFAGANQMFAPPAVTVPEERHIQHVEGILTTLNAGRQDFMSFRKMVAKMSTRTQGPALWTNAFDAFSGINDTATPQSLLISADEYIAALNSDMQSVRVRHEGKFSSTTSAIGGLTNKKQALEADIIALQTQLEQKQAELQQTNQDLVMETQKADGSFTSYTLANTSTRSELEAYKTSINNYLIPKV